MTESNSEAYNWSRFYQSLCHLGPELLTGIGSATRELIISVGSSTDAFWSDGLQDLLAGGAAEGDLRGGVLSALDLWRENVLQVLADDFALELDWKTVTIDRTHPIVDKLVEAAAIN